jgi:hypothetical protein
MYFINIFDAMSSALESAKVPGRLIIKRKLLFLNEFFNLIIFIYIDILINSRIIYFVYFYF